MMVVMECLTRSIADGEMTYTYFYRIVKHEVQLEENTSIIKVQTYGIEAERYDYNNGTLVNIERDCINNIGPQRHKVHNLLKLLYDNAVSPIHLVDVLGVYVDEQVSDFCSNENMVAVQN
ncbi:DUF6514 family protein [Clostridium oryzae]|uniref:Uncharacterized protein n=1 Tax=Clostridium oryzae TaxID=1450648 RepID=A0A1V4IZ91_9CLOT|nr:DUF6514 family protein [Clostridium oryzae]OPJ65095.1 hypothetical protein CLORY_00950 [Clostridium oryzae]